MKGEGFETKFFAIQNFFALYSRRTVQFTQGALEFLQASSTVLFALVERCSNAGRVIFEVTHEREIKPQQREIYRHICAQKPIPSFSKPDCHYYLPSFIGFWLYRKFHGYHMC